VTSRPTRAAAAIALGLALSPLVGAVPAAAQTSPGLPTEVALVVPLTVPAGTSGLVSAELLENYTSEFGLLTRSLNQVDGRPVTIAVDPMIIASIRVLGTAAPESAVLWLERLAALPNETFALSWADSNLTLGLDAGSPAVLAPESLGFAIDPTRFGAAEVEPTGDPSATPSATPEPDDSAPPPLPTTESLLEWAYALPSVGWPAADSVSASTLSVLGATYEHTLISSDNLADFTGLTATATVGDSSVIVADSSLSSLFGTTVESSSDSAWEAAVATLTTAIAGEATQPSADSAVLTLDRSIALTDLDLGATIDAIDAIPSVQLVGLSAVADNTGPTATVVDGEQDAASIDTVAGLLTVEGLDAEFAQIADDPSRVTSERRLDLLATLSNSWTDNAAGWAEAVSDYRAASSALRGSVKIIKSSSITLWADRGSLPVIVENNLDQPVTVFITVRALTPLIRVEDSFFEFVVEPNSQRKAPVPVQSISNGVVELEIALHGATGQQIGNTTYVRTTVQAGWETPFTIGVGIVVVLIFAAGVVRTIVRLRRARAKRITIA